MNLEYIIAKSRFDFENTEFIGEAFPTVFPNPGPDIPGAICGGCDIRFGETTSWAQHGVGDWDSVKKIVFDPDNGWWKKIFEMTKGMCEDAEDLLKRLR